MKSAALLVIVSASADLAALFFGTALLPLSFEPVFARDVPARVANSRLQDGDLSLRSYRRTQTSPLKSSKI